MIKLNKILILVALVCLLVSPAIAGTCTVVATNATCTADNVYQNDNLLFLGYDGNQWYDAKSYRPDPSIYQNLHLQLWLHPEWETTGINFLTATGEYGGSFNFDIYTYFYIGGVYYRIGGAGETRPEEVTASLTCDPMVADIGEIVTCTDTSSNATAVDMNFGDSGQWHAMLPGETLSHAYNETGSYYPAVWSTNPVSSDLYLLPEPVVVGGGYVINNVTFHLMTGSTPIAGQITLNYGAYVTDTVDTDINGIRVNGMYEGQSWTATGVLAGYTGEPTVFSTSTDDVFVYIEPTVPPDPPLPPPPIDDDGCLMYELGIEGVTLVYSTPSGLDYEVTVDSTGASMDSGTTSGSALAIITDDYPPARYNWVIYKGDGSVYDAGCFFIYGNLLEQFAMVATVKDAVSNLGIASASVTVSGLNGTYTQYTNSEGFTAFTSLSLADTQTVTAVKSGYTSVSTTVTGVANTVGHIQLNMTPVSAYKVTITPSSGTIGTLYSGSLTLTSGATPPAGTITAISWMVNYLTGTVPLSESATPNTGANYVLREGTWYGWDNTLQTFTVNKGTTMPNPTSFNLTQAGTYNVFCVVYTSTDLQFTPSASVTVGAGTNLQLITVHAKDYLTGLHVSPSRFIITNLATGISQNLTETRAGEVDVQYPVGSNLNLTAIPPDGSGYSTNTLIYNVLDYTGYTQHTVVHLWKNPSVDISNTTANLLVKDNVLFGPISGAYIILSDGQSGYTSSVGSKQFTLANGTTTYYATVHATGYTSRTFFFLPVGASYSRTFLIVAIGATPTPTPTITVTPTTTVTGVTPVITTPYPTITVPYPTITVQPTDTRTSEEKGFAAFGLLIDQVENIMGIVVGLILIWLMWMVVYLITGGKIIDKIMKRGRR